MACQCSIVYGKEASRAVLDFSTVGQLEKVSLTGSANGARLSYSLKNDSLMFEPNYTVNTELLFDFGKTSYEKYNYIKIRYYLNGNCADGSYSYINVSGKKHELYRIKSGQWTEEVAELPKLSDGDKNLRFCPLTSESWSSKLKFALFIL